MTGRRVGMLVAAVALVCTPLAAVGAAGAAKGGGSKNQFSNLKTIKAPSPCKEDPGVSGTEIKVGGIVPTSGSQAASFGPAVDGIQARFDKANAEKELGKYKLTYVNEDSASDPARNLNAAQALVEQDKVFGVIEVDIAGDGSAAYLNQNKIPVTGWHVGRGVWGKDTNMFPFADGVPPDPTKTFTTLSADVIKKQGGTKVALVGYNNPSSVAFIQNINDAVGKTPGLKVAYKTVDVPVDATDFGAVAQKIKESGADALYTGMDFGPNTALTGALKQAGVNLKAVVFPGGYDSRAAGIPGMDQAIFGLEFKPFELNTAAYQDFTKWMGDKFKNQVSAIGWLSADTFIQGIKAAGVECPTRAAFINNLRMVKNYDAGGFVDPINFADVFGKSYLCQFFVQVQNKAFAPLYNGKPLCAAGVIDNGKYKKGTTGGAGPSTGIPPQ